MIFTDETGDIYLSSTAMHSTNESVIYHHPSSSTIVTAPSNQQHTQAQTVYRLIPMPTAGDTISSVQFHHQSVIIVNIICKYICIAKRRWTTIGTIHDRFDNAANIDDRTSFADNEHIINTTTAAIDTVYYKFASSSIANRRHTDWYIFIRIFCSIFFEGQCYLLMNPQDLLVPQRNDAKGMTTSAAATFIPLSRFEAIPQPTSPTSNVVDSQYSSKRKVSHNEGKNKLYTSDPIHTYV